MAKHNKRKNRRRANPVGAGTVLLGTAALVGAGYLVYDALEAKPKAKKKDEGGGTPGRARLSGVYAENATLGNSPDILNVITLPLKLGSVGAVVLRSGNGLDCADGFCIYDTLSINPGMVRANGNETLDISWKNALKQMVTNMTASSTAKAWKFFREEAAKGTDLSTVSPALDAAIIKALGIVAPGTNWSSGLAPYAGNSVEAIVWTGLALLASIAHQHHRNKQPIPVEPDGWPSDEEIPGPTPDDVPITPEEQELIDSMNQKFNGILMQYKVGDVLTEIERDVVALLEDDSGFSAVMGIYADDKTQENGQYLGVAYWTTADKNAGVSYRSSTSASVPDQAARITALREKLLVNLSTIQENN